jgi:hypothetical protein
MSCILIIPEKLVGKKPHNVSSSVYPLISFASVCFWYVLSNWSIDKPLSHSGLFSIRLTLFILSPFEYPFFSTTGRNVNTQTVCILRVFVCSQMPKRGRSRVCKKMLGGGSERVGVAVKTFRWNFWFVYGAGYQPPLPKLLQFIHARQKYFGI